MSTDREHAYVPQLRQLLVDRRCDRREFLRTATLLGVSAFAASGFADRVLGPEAGVALAQGAPRKGGSLRLAARVREIPSPHAMGNVPASNSARQTIEYLAWTGYDNVTRPMLLEKWTPSEDLKTWTLHVRKNVKWRKGRQFTADDVIWNIKSVLDPKTGSSVLGLMKGYILEDFDSGEKVAQGRARMSSRLWDSRASPREPIHEPRPRPLREKQSRIGRERVGWPLVHAQEQEAAKEQGFGGETNEQTAAKPPGRIAGREQLRRSLGAR